jgi:hypothetical protein
MNARSGGIGTSKVMGAPLLVNGIMRLVVVVGWIETLATPLLFGTIAPPMCKSMIELEV